MSIKNAIMAASDHICQFANEANSTVIGAILSQKAMKFAKKFKYFR